MPPLARRFPPLVAVALPLGLIACGGSAEPIRLGLAAPLGQARGTAMRIGAELAVTEINARGGIRGRALALVVEDDSARVDVAVRVAQQLYDTEGLVAVVGHLTSSATIAAAPVYGGGERPLVQLSPSASSPFVTNAGPYTFRVCPADGVHGVQLAAWAWDRIGARSLAIIYENDDYGRALRSIIAQSFTDRGGRVVTADPFIASLPVFEPYLRRLSARGGADALVIAGSRAGGEPVLHLLDSLGLDYPVLGADALAGMEGSGIGEGTYISVAYLPDRASERNTAFVAAYRDAAGQRAPDHRAAGAYDAVHLLAQAIAAVGADRGRIRQYLAGVGQRTPPFEGVTGTIAFDANGDVTRTDVTIGVIRNRQLVTAPVP